MAPAELEDVLRGLTDVEDVAVIGVESEREGEVPRAYIVRSSSALTEESVHRHMKENLAECVFAVTSMKQHFIKILMVTIPEPIAPGCGAAGYRCGSEIPSQTAAGSGSDRFQQKFEFNE